MFLTFVLTVFAFSKPWNAPGMELYEPLQIEEVLVKPNGEVLVLDFSEARIFTFAADGSFKGTIGRKGKGPGEFTYPAGFFYMDSNLAVFDFADGRMTLFDDKHEYESRFKIKKRNMDLVMVKGGWAFGEWHEFGASGPVDVQLAGPKFKNRNIVTVTTLEERGYPGGFYSQDDPETRKRVSIYGPITNRPIMKASADGSTLFVTHTDRFAISVIDVASQKVTRVIEQETDRIPFDKDWADADFEQFLKDRPEQRSRGYKKKYPEYFPTIRDFIIDPNGNLVVQLWRGNPDSPKQYTITVTPEGEKVDGTYEWAALQRLAGVVGKDGIVTMFDNEEEIPYFAKVPLAELNTFVENNPIEWDGSGPRVMVSEGE